MPRWTAEARAKQSEIQRTRQSWKHSTGPKTSAGKKRSSLNAYKHGLHDRTTRSTRRFLRLNGQFLTSLNKLISQERQKLRLSNNASLRAQQSNPSINDAANTERWIAASATPPRNDNTLPHRRNTENIVRSNGCELIFRHYRHILVGTPIRPSAFSAHTHIIK